MTKKDQQPDVCISCGAFTDRRFKAKAVGTKSVWVKDDAGKVAVGCILGLLGPLGWIISMAANSGDSPGREKKVKVTGSLAVSQCEFCQAQSPATPVDFDWEGGAFAFEVHDRFRVSFKRVNLSEAH